MIIVEIVGRENGRGEFDTPRKAAAFLKEHGIEFPARNFKGLRSVIKHLPNNEVLDIEIS